MAPRNVDAMKPEILMVEVAGFTEALSRRHHFLAGGSWWLSAFIG
jgi:hypothetical protein